MNNPGGQSQIRHYSARGSRTRPASPSVRRGSMFSWRTKATQQQHEQVEIERVEAEARARAEEAALLNAEVAKRLRTRSGEGEAPGSDEGATLPTGGRTGRRRSSANLTVDRRGSVSTKEADLINQLVKQRSAAQVERRKTRSREQLAMEEAAKEFKRAAAAKAEGATDAADGNEESPPQIVSPPQRAIPSKWLSARERLQAMTREFEERKLAATGGSENGQRPEDTSNSSALSPNAKNLGAARAAAKVRKLALSLSLGTRSPRKRLAGTLTCCPSAPWPCAACGRRLLLARGEHRDDQQAQSTQQAQERP